MEEYTYELKIPKERIAVLIGKDGQIKTELEEQTKISIHIDSQEGDVVLKGTDSVNLYLLKDVIKAVGRGFNPEVATRLLKQDYVLELIQMSDFVKSKDSMIRLKGRVIGKGGKARETIEELTNCSISVYGKTISIIGFCDDVPICKRAVESLLTGSPHSSIYKWLEKNRKANRQAQAIGF
ncbi:MAG: RNA-processing protein [Nanoarchaeota archaeon]|nr:RNA-processing protein [Nanoarchaeota archaeon]